MRESRYVLLGKAGLEPARGITPGDFKSPASAIPPLAQVFILRTLPKYYSKIFIVLTGGWDIEAEFVNNAYVVAEEDHHGLSGVLTLKDQPKSGHGYWMAEPTGELRIEETVTGDATWQIDIGGRIVIDATCTSLTGHVMLSAGTLEVKLNFKPPAI